MKSKKVISVVLAIVLCVMATVVVVTANAKTVNIQILTDKSEISTGESATVSLLVSTNFPVATMSVPVFYDKNLVSVSDAVATLTDYNEKRAIIDSQSADSSKIYKNTTINEDDFGFVLVNYIGGANEDVPESINEVVLTFKITAKTDVNGEAVIKCVSESAKTGNNVAGMLYFGSTTSGTVIDSVPENVENIDVTDANQTVTITKRSEPNTIAIKESAPYNPIIDTVNKGEFTGTLYGIDTLGCDDTLEADGNLADFLTTTYGDEYLQIVVGDSGVETTGTVINVLDEDGNIVETYVFVYFGDVDMDGMITSTDGFFAEYYEANGEGLDGLHQVIAGDVDMDGMVTSTDGFFMEYFEATGEGIDTQQEIAESVVELVYNI